ncbi:MAG: hypothetical protein ACJASL_000264 [Paraglaciecola sp.]|jgi:hypothetical protein
MSNKKLFWIAFLTLSCCEFGQFAYSKDTSTSIQATQLNNMSWHCSEEIMLGNDLLFNKQSAHFLLPK